MPVMVLPPQYEVWQWHFLRSVDFDRVCRSLDREAALSLMPPNDPLCSLDTPLAFEWHDPLNSLLSCDEPC